MKASPFQIGVIIFFVVFIILALLVFTGVIGGGGAQSQQAVGGQVTLWGTYPQDVMNKLVSEYNAAHQKAGYSITYVPIQAGDLNSKLAEAIASGTGPDLVVLSQDQILKNQSKLYAIPYTTVSEATFRSTFAGEGEMFMLTQGIVGLPLTIDPLIMYYNRDLLEAGGFTTPPKTWNELTEKTPLLTKRDGNSNIVQSAVPFGIYSNLNHARDVLSMLLFQAGNGIVTRQADKFLPVIGISATQQTASSQVAPPAEAVVKFFTQFVDPTKDTYTWNRSFTNARTQFISGQLAFYIGYASELPMIVAQNPNLNFDISKVPQSGTTGVQMTFGKIQALAIVKASKNRDAALYIASDLTGVEFSAKLIGALIPVSPVAPARRDLLAQVPQILFGPVLYSSAIISRGWYDPGADLTDPIFNSLVDNVVRGATNATQAVSDAQSKFSVIFGY